MFINDNVFDSGLAYAVTNGSDLHILNADAGGTYGNVATFTVGNETLITVGSPQAGAVDGRRVVVPAITAGDVTATDTATHWALTDGASILVASGALTTPQAVTSGNTFTLDAIDITIRDAA